MVFWVTSLPSFQWMGQPSHLIKSRKLERNPRLTLGVLVDLWAIVLQGGVRVVVWPEGVGFSEDGVTEELVLLEEEAQGEARVVRAVEGDLDVSEVGEDLLVVWLQHFQQSFVIGVLHSVEPELGDALGVLVVVLQCQLSQSVLQLLLLVLLRLLPVTGPVSLLCRGLVFPTK